MSSRTPRDLIKLGVPADVMPYVLTSGRISFEHHTRSFVVLSKHFMPDSYGFCAVWESGVAYVSDDVEALYRPAIVATAIRYANDQPHPGQLAEYVVKELESMSPDTVEAFAKYRYGYLHEMVENLAARNEPPDARIITQMGEIVYATLCLCEWCTENDVDLDQDDVSEIDTTPHEEPS